MSTHARTERYLRAGEVVREYRPGKWRVVGCGKLLDTDRVVPADGFYQVHPGERRKKDGDAQS
jgi:hypothetical protein